ncbi:hypothetical protein OHA72_04575 [Dactylosporangium sp. NBC_01737]|uniref:hypothetical protein n=1 Tax=Dactylosporangium sp. NBC_01737 TaxID=2975959 RepID=UPI002E0D811E|nr:hypothetical protein OHA72_04575 [Dactylosporangium sp. NBC_01737]
MSDNRDPPQTGRRRSAGHAAALRTAGPAPLWAGAAAAVTALALHSAFDFLWELAVVPLLLGVLVGIAGPPHGEESAPTPNGEESS